MNISILCVKKIWPLSWQEEHGSVDLSPSLTVPTRRLLFALSRPAPRQGFRSFCQQAVLRQDLGSSP